MKQTGPIRWLVMMLLGGAIIAGLAACNSNETLLSQKPPSQTPAPPGTPPPDNARRITADELHKLWEKNDVVIIDTRAEPAYKQEHIKGALLMPAGTVLQHIDELPKNKLIAAYCT
jgi:Rhodanese-like domain